MAHEDGKAIQRLRAQQEAKKAQAKVNPVQAKMEAANAQRRKVATALAAIDERNKKRQAGAPDAVEKGGEYMPAARITLDIPGHTEKPETPPTPAEPEAQTPAPTLRELPAGIRAKTTFKLFNARDAGRKVMMAVLFADNATEQDVATVESAIAEYTPKRMQNDEGEPLLIIGSTTHTAALVEKLVEAKIPVGKSPAFQTTQRFDDLLGMRDVRWRNPGAAAPGRG